MLSRVEQRCHWKALAVSFWVLLLLVSIPRGAAAQDCDDGNACTTEAFNPETGLCEVTSNVICDDGNACTTQACNPETGQCEVTSNLICDDDNVCTNDACNPATGLCETRSRLNCNDMNACTKDGCDPTTGCIHAPVNCDDGDICTAESCDPQSGCGHTLITTGPCEGVDEDPPCNDGNPCTDDSRSRTLGCVHTANSAACNDGNECTTVDQCSDGVCVGGGTKSCNDNNPCTADSCNPVVGTCSNVAVICADDGNRCTTESCDTATGMCTSTAVSCDDNNACTLDHCSPTDGCWHSAKCDDGTPCTVDNCDPASGECSPSTPDDSRCTDGAFCDGQEKCDPANPSANGDGCVSGVPPCGPNPDDRCKTISCDEQTDACVATDVDCSDSNLCTLDRCDPASGCVSTPRDCSDENLCTADSCELDTGECVHTPVICGSAKITGGGGLELDQIFAFVAMVSGDGSARGQFQYRNGAGRKIHGQVVAVFWSIPTPSGGQMKFRIADGLCTYVVTATDGGTPGTQGDRLHLEYEGGPCDPLNTGDAPLTAGDVMFHQQE